MPTSQASPAKVLLGLLAAGPSHGHALKQRYDTHFPETRPPAYAQVHATLQDLVRDGLAAQDAAAGGGPERAGYRITPRGRAQLQAWLHEIVRPAPFVADQILTKAVVAVLAGSADAAAAYLDAQHTAHVTRIEHLEAARSAPGATRATVLSADYALHHLAADLEWMNELAGRLDALVMELKTR
ncbi:PadR family transcriptional regulator [Streptomyces sp. A7024]|uniref:PadR family transcriptional regulator n=1 Tax=Streptomyces coryli TaxID=1128680 RepID=A0A6G4TVI5_9ACTN|nr:PadR family transcriptional regulator [Streptomyces coryli]NGN63128.1 PadR family transcriptional regulator [Streptomyces coryli]